MHILYYIKEEPFKSYCVVRPIGTRSRWRQVLRAMRVQYGRCK